MKPRRLIVICALLMLGFGSRARAAESSYDRCMDAADAIDPKMRDCADAEYGARDGELNEVYKRLMAAVGPDRKIPLRDAQRAWISFRDKECDFEYPTSAANTGSLDFLEAEHCLINITKKRTADLRLLLKAEIAYPDDK